MEFRKSDYESYDYREFWKDKKRQYEDYSERRAIRKLLKGFNKKNIIADIGCGFGRLFNEYCDFRQVIMLDYSINNLKNAQKSVNDFYLKNLSACKPAQIYFIAADAENIPVKNENLDMVFSVRLMHHLGSTQNFIDEAFRILKKNRLLVLEFANKKNLKNILKFIFKRSNKSPFSPVPLSVGDTIRNYHPKEILKEMKKSGFKIVRLISVSNFRINFLKRRVCSFLLNAAENLVQNIFSGLKLGPSIFIKAVKPAKDNFFTDGNILSENKLLMCSYCKNKNTGFSFNNNLIICDNCGKEFKIIDGIYDFRVS